MATCSTPEENDVADTRLEYAPPPCIEEPLEGVEYDEDGLEVVGDGSADAPG